MLRINCFIETTPETRDQVLAYALALTENSLQEKGCKAYDIFASASRPQVLMICETWESEADLEAHRETAHYKEYSPKLRELAKLHTEKFQFPAK